MAAGCSANAFRSRINDGISRLRQRLVKRGCTLGIPALIGVLEAEAHAAIPETLIPSLMAVSKLAAAGAAAGTASANITYMMEGALKTMFIAKIKMVGAVAATVLLVGSVGVFAAKEFPKKTNVVAKEEPAVANTPVIQTQAQNEITPDKSEKNGTGTTVQKQANPPAKTNASSQDRIDAKTKKIMAEPKKKDAKPEISQATKDLKKKLDSIVVKHLEFEETPFEGVLEACKVEALAGDPGKKGVNIFLIGISKETLEAKVNLVVDYLPLSELIEILCRMNGLQYKVEDNGVVILPAEPKPEDNFKDVKE